MIAMCNFILHEANVRFPRAWNGHVRCQPLRCLINALGLDVALTLDVPFDTRRILDSGT